MNKETGIFQKINHINLNENKEEQVRSLEIVGNKDDIVQMLGGEDLNRHSPVSIGGDYSKDELQYNNIIPQQNIQQFGGEQEALYGGKQEALYGGEQEALYGGERKSDIINDQLLAEKSMNEQLVMNNETDGNMSDNEMTDSENTGNEMTDSENTNNEMTDNEMIEEDMDEELEDDFELIFDDEMEEDVELMVKKSETEYTAEDEIIYRDLLHNFRKNPQYVSKFKVNKDTNIVQLPEHIIKLSKIVDDVIDFKNSYFNYKKLETIPVIDQINHDKYPKVGTKNIIPIVYDKRRIFKKNFKEQDNELLLFNINESQSSYMNIEKEYQPVMFNGTKGIEEYKRNRKLNELWRSSYLNYTTEEIDQKMDKSVYKKERNLRRGLFGLKLNLRSNVTKWSYDNNGNLIPKKNPQIFRFVDDNSCINMNQPDKKFLFDGKMEVLRFENDTYFNSNISNLKNSSIKINTFCGIEENEIILNPRVVLGENYGVSFDESDNLQLTKNYDGEVLMIGGYLFLPKKYDSLNEYLMEKDQAEIININYYNIDNFKNDFDIFNHDDKCILLDLKDINYNTYADLVQKNTPILEYFNNIIPDVKNLTNNIIDSSKSEIIDIKSINNLFGKYEISFDMFYKDLYYKLLNVIQENIFNKIDDIVSKNEKNLRIIDKEILKIVNYKNNNSYKIYNDNIFSNKDVIEHYIEYTDYNTNIDLEENRLNWVKYNYYINELINLEMISKQISKENYNTLKKEHDLINIEIQSYNIKEENIYLNKFDDSVSKTKDLSVFLNNKIKTNNDSEITLKEYNKHVHFKNLNNRKSIIEDLLEKYEKYDNIDIKIKRTIEKLEIIEKNNNFMKLLNKNLYHKINKNDTDGIFKEIRNEDVNKEEVKEVFGTLFETTYDTGIKINSNEGLKIVDMSTKQVDEDFVSQDYKNRINIDEQDNFLIILKKNPSITYNQIFPWIKTGYHNSIIEQIKNFVIKLNINMNKNNVENLVLSISKMFDLLPDLLIEKQKYIKLFRQNNKPIDLDIIRKVIEDKIDKRKAGIIVARLLIDLETNIPYYSFKTTFIPKRSKNVQDRVIDVIHYKPGNEINFLVDVGSVTAELGKRGKLMENTQAESLKEIKSIAEEYYEIYKSEPVIRKLYELRKIEDERIQKVGLVNITTPRYLNHGFDVVEDELKETIEQINKTELMDMNNRKMYKDYLKLSKSLQERSRYLTKKIMQIIHQKSNSVTKREGYNPKYFGEDEINLVPCVKKGTCISFDDLDITAGEYDSNDYYRYNKYIEESNLLNIKDKLKTKYSVFIFPKNQRKNQLNYTRNNMRYHFAHHSTDKINHIKKYCIKNSGKKYNTFSGKKAIPSKSIRNRCIDYINTEDEFMENYKQGMYTDDLYNELILELKMTNMSKLNEIKKIENPKKEGKILDDLNKSSKLINEFAKNTWSTHCKINNIQFTNDDLKKFWNKIISIGSYKKFYEQPEEKNQNLVRINSSMSRISNLKKTILNFRKHVNLLKNKLRTWENDYKFKRFSDDALMCDISISHVDKKMNVGNNIQVNRPNLFRRKIKDSSISTKKQEHLSYLEEFYQYRKLFKNHEFENSNSRIDKLTGNINSDNQKDISIDETGDLLLYYLIEEFNNLLNTGKMLDENENDADESISYNKIAVKFCIQFIDWINSKISIVDHSDSEINQMKRHLNYIVKTTQEVISREDMELQRINQETGYSGSKFFDADDGLVNQNNDYTDEAREALGLTNQTIDNFGQITAEAERIRVRNYAMGYSEDVDYSISNDDDYVDDENIMNIFEGETEE